MENENIKVRIGFLDAMRGMGILMVIYHHFIVMGMRDIVYRSVVDMVISMFFMPMFFFISGYLAIKLSMIQTFSSFLDIAKIRIKSLLVPTIVAFSICILFFQLNPNKYIFDSYKCGYWFTYCLFCIIIVFSFTSFLLNKIHFLMGGQTLLALFLFCIGKKTIVDDLIVSALSLDFICTYYGFFVLGWLFAHYKHKVNWVFKNRICSSLILLIALMPYFIKMPWGLCNICIPFQIFSIYWIFCYYSCFFEGNSMFAKGLRLFGKKSLEIYFIHYFFLFKIDFLTEWLIQLSSDYCFRGHSCVFIIEIIIIGGLSSLIAYLCLIVKRILIPFPLFTKFLFGR